MPTQKNIEIWRGNTETIPLEVKVKVGAVLQPVNLTGSTLHFRAEWQGGTLVKVLDITDAVLGLAEIRLTKEETRGVPQGAAAFYEIERWVGLDQKTIAYGRLIAAGGLNTDT